MNIAIRPGAIAFENFCWIVQEDQKADLIDGVIHMASPENTDANELFGWLFSVLGIFVRKRKLGKVYGSRVAFRLGEQQGPEPDIAFVRKDRLHLVRRGFVDGPPDLAVEIVSPESIQRDYEAKREQYRRARVPEYWIVDEMEQRVTLLRPTTRGAYREVRPRKGILHSQVVPGFYLRLAWLWQDPLPEELEVLAELFQERQPW
jgi:Uma2 family endonuclease